MRNVSLLPYQLNRWMLGLAIALLLLINACSTEVAAQRPASESAKTEVSQPEGLETGTASPAPVEPEAAPAALIEDLKSVLSARTGIPAAEIMFKSAEAVEWADACLGVPRPDEFCAQVITPGYRIMLGTLTKTYEFHADRSGKTFRLAARAEQPQPEEGHREPEAREPDLKRTGAAEQQRQGAGEEMQEQGK